MDFTRAFLSDTTEERDRLIRDVVEEEPWSLEDCLLHGGWDEVDVVESVKIDENAAEGHVDIRVKVTGFEYVTSSCKDLPHEHHITAYFLVKVDANNGKLLSCEMTDFSTQYGSSDDDDDYYPGDYI